MTLRRLRASRWHGGSRAVRYGTRSSAVNVPGCARCASSARTNVGPFALMNRPDELSTVPDEAIPRTELRRISLPIYGIHFFRDIFASRQLLSIVMRSRYTRKQTGGNRELNQMLTLWVGKVADLGNALCGWEPLAECPRHTLTRYDVPMAWDFAESVTWGRSSGSFSTIVSGTSRPLHRDGEGSRPADSRTGSSGTIVWRGRGRGRRRPPGETSHWSDSRIICQAWSQPSLPDLLSRDTSEKAGLTSLTIR